jgi:Ni/Fe-hydrogenase subunit HybB-like protein
VKGAWILIAFSITVPAAIAARLAGYLDVAETLRWLNAGLGISVAGYTAFLFAQCEGRDLWQSRLLLPHLLVQAGMLGCAVLMPFATGSKDLALWFGALLTLHGVLSSREARPHGTANARQARAFLKIARVGRLWRPYKLSMFVGTALPAVFVALSNLHRAHAIVPELLTAAAILAIAGLFVYESVYIRAGQLAPLS